MSSREDPWTQAPELGGGASSAEIEQIRAGDPSRFFPSPAAGVTDAVTGRILNVPRAAVQLTPLVPFSAGTAVLFWSGTPLWDNDGMTKGSKLALVCVTPGVYDTGFQLSASGGGVSPIGVQGRVLVNGNIASWTCIEGSMTPTSTWAASYSPSGPWVAKAGDTIGVYLEASAAVNITNGILWAQWVSSLGSDQQ